MRSRIAIVAIAPVLLATVAAGCGGQSKPDDSATSASDEKPSGSSERGPENTDHSFSGTGDDETESVKLSGDYNVRWEISGNQTKDDVEAAFSVLMHCDPGPSFTSIVSESETATDSGTKEIPGLENAKCYLEVHAEKRGQWSVELSKRLTDRSHGSLSEIEVMPSIAGDSTAPVRP